MNKEQIKDEIRRIACNSWTCDLESLAACDAVNEFCDRSEWLDDLSLNDCRTFFLLVAEAM